MKAIKTLSAVICALAILAGPAFAGDTAKDKKLTCCEKAKAAGKECTHKCCVAAHKEGKSCTTCNKHGEDLKKNDKKVSKKA